MTDIQAGRVLVAHQPAYLPWGGYFSRLLDVDKMIILDHVQFSERGYQHRNRIPDRHGHPHWLTVPVQRSFGQQLRDVHIADPTWTRRHWRTLSQTYAHAPHWPDLASHIEAIYSRQWTFLAELDIALIETLLTAMNMNVTLIRSSTLRPTGTRTDMLIDLCHRTGDRTLRVGTGALNYLDHAALHAAGIRVEVATYHDPQATNGTAMSAVDLLAHYGSVARQLLHAGTAITTPVTS